MAATEPDPTDLFDRFTGCRGVLLAVSGGRDSTALMALAARWAGGADEPVPMTVATVDHGIRPEAAAETRLVAENAKKLGFNCVILDAELPRAPEAEGSSGNLQARARQARYACLVDAARQLGYDTIATAHHRDDQAETLLLRLGRGSGVYGLGAMRTVAVINGLSLVRPLLGLDRSDLHRIADESGLASVEDPSNLDMAFSRVRLRSVMPQLASTGITPHRISETATRLQRAADALDQYAGDLLRSHVSIDDYGAAKADSGLVCDAPDETALRALARLLQAVGGTDYTPRLDRLEQLLAALRAKSGAGKLRRTLNNCLVDLESGQMCIHREWGRAGPAQMPAVPSGETIWDGRFFLQLPEDLPEGILIAPLGADAARFRGHAASAVLRTIPALFAGENLHAVPQIAEIGSGEGLPLFGCRSVVAERLLNPRTIPVHTGAEKSC